MDSDRRYTEDEVQEILQRATDVTERSERSLASFEGMTLVELQDIGREVGIDAQRIAAAATALDRKASAPPPDRTFMGTTIGVGRTVYLDRPLTEAEWHRLVLDLRETFDARGKVREEGSFRQWTNGNLQALLEPTDAGERLRLSTVKGDAKPALAAGLTMITVFSLVLILSVLTGSITDPGALGATLVWLLVGAVFFAVQRVRLPRWAATRELQMQGIIARLTAGLESTQESSSDDTLRPPSG